ncbi:cupin domain-containing protein [Nitratireductor sp. CH_MIT9313-5]|uniref:cupin domain-containing protein n=1 Tax=Nitratireductor sp. CH_MIT9313-5 TaxID=3107764 RepID=UPI00300A2E99
MDVRKDAPEEWRVSGPGAKRRILCQNPELMMVAFHFEKGGEGLPHSHPHVQTTYVTSGRFRFTVSGDTQDLGPGDAMLIPSNAEHSCLCLEEGELIDAFTPRRDDFMEAHELPL